MRPLTQTTAVRCPRCAERMSRLRLQGRHATDVEHCAACALVWFEPLEFDGLDRAAWVSLLLQAGAAAHDGAVAPAGPWACPRCAQPLEPRHLAGAHGRHAAMACPAGHGQAHGLAALLAARGLLQPLDMAERLLLQRSRQGLACLPCGAPLSAHDEDCAHCGSPLLAVNVPRLAQALGAVDAEEHTAAGRPRRAPPPAAQVWRWNCHGCGQVLDPSAELACRHCSAVVQAPRLGDLQPLLLQARERLAGAQARAMQQALSDLSDPELHRVAGVTGRPEHRAALVRAERRWWLRLGGIAAAFVAALALTWWNWR